MRSQGNKFGDCGVLISFPRIYFHYGHFDGIARVEPDCFWKTHILNIHRIVQDRFVPRSVIVCDPDFFQPGIVLPGFFVLAILVDDQKAVKINLLEMRLFEVFLGEGYFHFLVEAYKIDYKDIIFLVKMENQAKNWI